MELISKALEAVRRYPLCDSCLGRLFALMGYGIENRERGQAIKTILHMAAVSDYRKGKDVTADLIALAKCHLPTRRFLAGVGIRVDEERCYICGDLMEGVEKYAEMAVEQLRGLDFVSFAVGSTLPEELLEKEAEVVKSLLVTTGESVKHEVNRRIGKELLRRLSDKRVDKLRPNVVVNVDLVSGQVKVVRNPILIGGRYLKLGRKIAQAKRFGNVRTTLLEKLAYLRDTFGGEDHVIHVSGREDSDARMLGSGRPLVVEVKQPLRYTAQVAPFRDKDVIFLPVGFTDRNEVRRLKEKAKTDIKLYRVLVLSESPFKQDDLSKLSALSGATVTQYTPRRIKRLHPRKKRVRMVYDVAWRLVSPHVFELYIRCQGGLYVKEFVHGDGGRTAPNVAELLNTRLEVLELDVLYIE